MDSVLLRQQVFSIGKQPVKFKLQSHCHHNKRHQSKIMKNNNLKLHYIPSRREREHLHSQLRKIQQQESSESEKKSESSRQQQSKQLRHLTKTELNSLIARLHEDNRAKKALRQLQQQDQCPSEKPSRYHSLSANQIPIEVRLMQQGKQREERLQQMRKIKQKLQVRQLKDRPMISQTYRVYQKHISQRYQQEVQKQEEHLKEVQKTYQPSFQPSINPHSRFIAEIINQNDPNLINRLTNRDNSSQKALHCVTASAEEKETLFKPNINKKSRQIAENMRGKETSDDRAQRMSGFGKPNSKFLTVDDNRDAQCTFHPKVCAKSSNIVSKNMNRQVAVQSVKPPSSRDDVGTRLYQNAKNIQLKLEHKKKQEENKYSHQPHINRSHKKQGQQQREKLREYTERWSKVQTFEDSADTLDDQEYMELWGEQRNSKDAEMRKETSSIYAKQSTNNKNSTSRPSETSKNRQSQQNSQYEHHRDNQKKHTTDSVYTNSSNTLRISKEPRKSTNLHLEQFGLGPKQNINKGNRSMSAFRIV